MYSVRIGGESRWTLYDFDAVALFTHVRYLDDINRTL